MSNVQTFPYEILPQYSSEAVHLNKKLLNAYYFFESRTHILEEMARPLQDILKTDLKIRITHVESSQLEEIIQGLPDKTLLGVVGLKPHSKKAVLLFETLLAKILVHKILSGDPLSPDKFAQMQTKPLSALEESVVQYVLISAIEKISPTISTQNFTIAYDDVLTDPKKLMGFFSNQDQFAVFSLQLSMMGRDFYLKLVLPISIAENMGITQIDECFVKERLNQFGMFQVNLQLELAHVQLGPNDINDLQNGDIVMFDDVMIQLEGSRLSGLATVRVAQSDSSGGYLVQLDSRGETIKAKVESAL